MIKITQEMKSIMAKVKTPVVATASKDGQPNVVPIAFTKIISDNEILLMDNYMNKTRLNIEENPEVAISIWDQELHMGYQFKGKARIETSGNHFAEGVEWVKSRRPQTVPRAAIIVAVSSIFAVGPGDNAGRQIT
jgi:uncharacterized protein